MPGKSRTPDRSSKQESTTTTDTTVVEEDTSNSAALDASGLSQTPPADPAADEEKARIAALRGRLGTERGAISGAGSFSDIASAIEKSESPKKGEAAIKLRNTDRGVERARSYFQSEGMVAEEKAFITDRYDGALKDQRTGIAESAKSGGALAQLLAKPDAEVAEADYSNLQWDAVFGANSATTLKQELVSPDDMKASVEVAQARGGLAKLIGLGNLWKAMDSGLQNLWAEAHGGKKEDAQKAWTAQTKAARAPAIVPTRLGPLDTADFAAFSSLDKAFSKPTSGCMGMGEDYQFDSIKGACDALGLQPSWYADGAFVLSIAGGEVAAAVESAKAAGGGIGKATVFTSLMFSEFNYIVEDRATNETESGDASVNAAAKQNSGKKSGGKTEVVVTEFPASVIFAQSPTFLG